MSENCFIAGYPEEEIKIFRAKLSAFAGKLEYYESLLSPEEQARAQSLCISAKRRSYILSHGILHTILGSFLKQQPEAVTISYDRAGAPLAAGETGSALFSLSYSGDYALYSVSRSRPSGIDVQKWRAAGDPLRFARRYFSAEENALLQNTRNSDRLSIFYRIWTRKEACTKALGMGRAIPFDSFEVRPGTPSPEISIPLPDGRVALLASTDLSCRGGYSAAAAALISGTLPRFIQQSLDPLIFE